jgi:hypothetical protein
VPTSRLDAAIFDSRYEYPTRFAAALDAMVPTYKTQSDVSRVWYAQLRDLLSAPSSRLIGLTNDSDFFILSQLAVGLGRQGRRLSEHDARRRETLAHRIHCGATTEQLPQLASARDWTGAIAAMAVAAAEPFRAASPLRIDTDIHRSDDFPGYLVAWVIE